jgi:REP element-mobilizing transposase RayT
MVFLMVKYNPEFHRRRSIRLKGYNYSQAGAYFVTICSYKKELIFEDIMVASIINKQWQNLPQNFSSIRLDEFVIMPNHIHFILWIKNVGATLAVAHKNKTTNKRAGASPAPTLGDIVGAFKSMVSTEYLKWINQNNVERSATLWQRNYYEHIIRNEESLNRIREYIINNTLKWEDDIENPLNWEKGKAKNYYDRIF